MAGNMTLREMLASQHDLEAGMALNRKLAMASVCRDAPDAVLVEILRIVICECGHRLAMPYEDPSESFTASIELGVEGMRETVELLQESFRDG